MSKIKIGELREILKQTQKDNIKTVDYHGLSLKIKQYIPISEKIKLAASIFESAIDKSEGYHILNGNNLDIAFKFLLVQTYVDNLVLPKNPVTAYDLLCESGLYNLVYSNIPEDEMFDLKMAIDNIIIAEQEKYDQSMKFEKIIKDGVDGLLVKLDKFIELTPTMESMEKMPGLITDIYKQMQHGIESFTGEDREYAETVTRVALEDVKNSGNV